MKYALLTLLSIGLFTACGDAETANTEALANSETSTNSETASNCLVTPISLTYFEKLDHDSIIEHDCTFTAKGSAGSFDKGRLRVIIGDAANPEGLKLRDYQGINKYSVQISLDDVKVGEYNVLDSHTPVQPYIEGKSVAFFGTSAAFPGGTTSGTVTISSISEDLVCGSIDINAYHGGVIKGDFSAKLAPKY